MSKKKERDCTECIAYCNMLGGEGYKCGLGFEVIEDCEGGYGAWSVVVHPAENSCNEINLPATKEAFVEAAARRGIEWDIDEVADLDDLVGKSQENEADIEASWCDGASDALNNFVVYETRRIPSRNESVKKGELVGSFKHVLRFIYSVIKQSPLCNVFYCLNDLYFVITAKMQGKPRICQKDIAEVEENVTFIFKSFNRQRQAKRLYSNIKEYYPNAEVIIADDSESPLNLPGVIHLPFNSGLSRGLQTALDAVKTPYVVRLDDDMLLTPSSCIHSELEFLKKHPEVDLVAVMADYKRPRAYALKFSRIRMNKRLIIPAGTMIEGKEVVYKVPNCFIARTEKMRSVGYDENIRINEHHEFFSRAAGEMVCVLDPEAYIMHCHNRFEKQKYDIFRYDTRKATQYLRGKHISRYQISDK